ncbi:MAG: hypothetical protein LW817_00750, partial [Candidatus Caenarcaniphilales bacterium]|nr:hypothetical protein [Candidatus Caenarcaniphilales bacterium]
MFSGIHHILNEHKWPLTEARKSLDGLQIITDNMALQEILTNTKVNLLSALDHLDRIWDLDTNKNQKAISQNIFAAVTNVFTARQELLKVNTNQKGIWNSKTLEIYTDIASSFNQLWELSPKLIDEVETNLQDKADLIYMDIEELDLGKNPHPRITDQQPYLQEFYNKLDKLLGKDLSPEKFFKSITDENSCQDLIGKIYQNSSEDQEKILSVLMLHKLHLMYLNQGEVVDPNLEQLANSLGQFDQNHLTNEDLTTILENLLETIGGKTNTEQKACQQELQKQGVDFCLQPNSTFQETLANKYKLLVIKADITEEDFRAILQGDELAFHRVSAKIHGVINQNVVTLKESTGLTRLLDSMLKTAQNEAMKSFLDGKFNEIIPKSFTEFNNSNLTKIALEL